MKDFMILRSRQRREEEEFENVDRQLTLDRLDIARDRFRRVGGKAKNVPGPGHDMRALPGEQHFPIFPDLVLTLLRAHERRRIDVLKSDEDRVAAGARRLFNKA